MTRFTYIFTFIILLLSTSTYADISSNEQFFLLPKDKDKAIRALYKKIDTASSTIHISIYNFTHKKIAKKLKNAARRGVKIEIIFDEKSTKSKQSKSMLPYLAKYKNITLYRLKGKLAKNKRYHGIMHMKMATIDNKTVIFGSANWTYSAFSNNYELLYITRNYHIAKKFENYFRDLKHISTLYR